MRILNWKKSGFVFKGAGRVGFMAALSAGLLGLFFPKAAEAAPCTDLMNPVYVTGGGKVLVENLAKVLSPLQINIVYFLQGSCKAVDAILADTPITGIANYWDAAGNKLECDLNLAGDIAHIGISDVFASTCQNLPNGLPSTVRDYFGPVEAYGFVVPKSSSQVVISREAAYFVYGFGAESGVLPWDNESLIFQRDIDSGTQQMIGLAIGVPPERWKGTSVASSTDLVAAINTSSDAEKTIGILTAEAAGANSLQLNMLAYQAKDQSCGYWPDSTRTSKDKRNVRDGHYDIWGPIHVLTRVDNNGIPLDARAADLIDYMTGVNTPSPGFNLIDILADAGLIPLCAMRVSRNSELGPLVSYAPERLCACYYDSRTTGKADCATCADDSECGESAPRCNYGFCEVQ